MHIDDVVFVFQMKSKKELQWHSREHSHERNQYEIHYFLQGEGTFTNNKTSINIKPGSLYFSLPKELHSIRANNISRPLTYYAVLFSLDSSSDKDTEDLILNLQQASKTYEIGTTFRFFFEEIQERSRSLLLYQQKSSEYQFLSFLYRIPDSSPSEESMGNSNHHIEKALKILQNSIFTNLSLDSLAEKLHLTSPYLVRLFRNKMNITPMKYYMKLRIEAAASMLINTDQTISLIASKLHFSSEFHLSRSFKQYKGLPPRDYREKYYQKHF